MSLHKKNKINKWLSSNKCDLNDINFIKPNDWTLQIGSLKANLFYVFNCILSKTGRLYYLSQYLMSSNQIAKPLEVYRCRQNYLITLQIADLNFNDKYFPNLPCSKAVCNSVRSSKPICTSNVRASKPVSTSHVRASKSVSASNVRSSERFCTSNICTSKPVSDSFEYTSKPVFTRNFRTSKSIFTSHVCSSKPICTNHIRSSKSACASNVRLSKPVCTGNVRSSKSDTTSHVHSSKLVYTSNFNTRQPISMKCRKKLLSSVFYLSALFWEFLLLGIFVNNNFYLISNNEFVFYNTSIVYNAPNCCILQ